MYLLECVKRASFVRFNLAAKNEFRAHTKTTWYSKTTREFLFYIQNPDVTWSGCADYVAFSLSFHYEKTAFCKLAERFCVTLRLAIVKVLLRSYTLYHMYIPLRSVFIEGIYISTYPFLACYRAELFQNVSFLLGLAMSFLLSGIGCTLSEMYT